jgi:putative transposase
VEHGHTQISVKRQCQLLGLSRSSFYYKSSVISQEDIELMNLIDEEYTRHPFYGTRRMKVWLEREGYSVSRKRVRRLYRVMGITAVYPKKNLSKKDKSHAIFPYLLRDMAITEVDKVWSTDITYIRLEKGFVYLMAIIDWYSRYVLDWSLSVTLEADFCIETLARVLERGRCDIFNTDQGSQFTTPDFTGLLLARGIRVSMDGKGRALDNIFIERLWRSVKYESVYLMKFASVTEAKMHLKKYFDFYNHERPHQALNYKTPAAVYFEKEREACGYADESFGPASALRDVCTN